MSSTNFGSVLIFASCVVGICNILRWVSFFLMGGVLFFCFCSCFCFNRYMLVLFFSTEMVGVGIIYKGSAPRAADAARYARARKILTNKCEGGSKKRPMILCN